MTLKKKLTFKQLQARRVERLMKRARREVAAAGGRARWANTTPEARSEAMRGLALAKYAKGDDDAGSTS